MIMWEKALLKDVINKPLSGEWGDGEGETKVIRTTNFTNEGVLDLSDVVKRNIPVKKIESKRLQYGDIIIEKSGGSPTQPVGRVVHFLEKSEVFLCNNFTSMIRPLNIINSRYLFWYLFSSHIKGSTLKYQNKTTGIINLQLERFCNELEVPLPPLEVQKQIADTLDKADELRKKDTLLLKKYDELAQSIFYDMFGDLEHNEKNWDTKVLRDLCDEIVDCPHTTPIHSSNITEYPCIRTSELINGFIRWSSMKYVGLEEYNKRTLRLKPQAGDIVYGREGSFGEAVILPKGCKMCLGQRTMLLRPNDKITNYFLWYQLRGDFVYSQALKMNCGATVGHVNVKDIKAFTIILPPLDIQKKFELVINNLIKSREASIMNIDKSETLFNGLLNSYFS